MDNAITDVKGVKVAHLTIEKDLPGPAGRAAAIRTGLTAVIPYPMEKPLRLFCANLCLKGNAEMTGYEVLDDFCYLNSPVVITNSFNVGRAYNAVLSYGFALNRDEVWPPVVIGLNDSYLNEMTKFSFDEKEVLQALFNAKDGKVEQGSVGVGVGLRAFDWKGGIGTSSRRLLIGGQELTCGVLAASNHGNSDFAEGSLSLVMATDVPLFPHQIRQVLRAVLAGLGPAQVKTNPAESVSGIFFSTANAMSMATERPFVFDYLMIDDSWLERISAACSEAVLESIRNSLTKATAVSGRQGRTVKPMPEDVLSKVLRI